MRRSAGCKIYPDGSGPALAEWEFKGQNGTHPTSGAAGLLDEHLLASVEPLAVVFCISLFLMIGVSYWTFRNQTQGHDPHTIVGAEDGEHH